jgi:formate-dependent nitrite reductase membrane component NrfD
VSASGLDPQALCATVSADGAGPGEVRSYYGRPVIKEPVWEPQIALYFFTGGLGGASGVLSLMARLTGQRALARRALLVGAGFESLSPLLLTSDLGRPERFLNMLRMLRPSSPMSVGSWVMSVNVASSLGAGALELLGRMPRVKLALELGSAVHGPAMSTYTAVLIANTAVPVWHGARRALPPLFAACSVASAGAACTLASPAGEAGPARVLAAGGALATLVIERQMRRSLGSLVSEPYRRGLPGRLSRASRALTAVGGALLAAPARRRRAPVRAGAALLLAGELALRFAVFRAGGASARDPRYTVAPQRERLAGRSPGAL